MPSELILCLQLGGALSSLIGLSFGAPVVAFESPADRLAAQRLHLPLPPGIPMEKMGITHVYHNADPIPMGVCTGVYSEWDDRKQANTGTDPAVFAL